jgi:hypothetical protein
MHCLYDFIEARTAPWKPFAQTQFARCRVSLLKQICTSTGKPCCLYPEGEILMEVYPLNIHHQV